MTTKLLLALTLFTARIVDPYIFLFEPGKPAPEPLKIACDDEEREYRLRKVEASSLSSFCLTIAEKGERDRVVSAGCYPPGQYVFAFDHGESRFVGAPGRGLEITAALTPSLAALDGGTPTPVKAAVVARAVIEIRIRRLTSP